MTAAVAPYAVEMGLVAHLTEPAAMEKALAKRKKQAEQLQAPEGSLSAGSEN